MEDLRVRREFRAAQDEERTTSGIAIRAPRSRTNLQPEKHRKRTSGEAVAMSSNLLTMAPKTHPLSSRSLLFAFSKKSRRLTRCQTSGTQRNPTSRSHPKKRTKIHNRLCSNSTSRRISPGSRSRARLQSMSSSNRYLHRLLGEKPVKRRTQLDLRKALPRCGNRSRSTHLRSGCLRRQLLRPKSFSSASLPLRKESSSLHPSRHSQSRRQRAARCYCRIRAT